MTEAAVFGMSDASDLPDDMLECAVKPLRIIYGSGNAAHDLGLWSPPFEFQSPIDGRPNSTAAELERFAAELVTLQFDRIIDTGMGRMEILQDGGDAQGLLREVEEEIQARVVAWKRMRENTGLSQGDERLKVAHEVAMNWGAKSIVVLMKELALYKKGVACYLKECGKRRAPWQRVMEL